MKSLLALLAVALVLTIIGAIFYAGYYAIDYLWNLYASLDAVIRIVLLSSMSVLLLSSLIIAGAIKASARVALKNRLMDAKLDLYQSLLGLYEQYLASPQQGTNEMIAKLGKLEPEVLLLASSSVLEVHGKLQTFLHGHEEVEDLSDLYEQLVKSIRRDLGHAPIYDESKLTCLLSPGKLENAQRPEAGISL